MKRHQIIIFAITGLGLCVLAASLILEIRDRDRLQQSLIKGLREKNIKERDSLELILREKNDSLKSALESIRIANEETKKANARSQREIRVLKNILFVQYSDSSRNAELTKLYPSFKPN